MILAASLAIELVSANETPYPTQISVDTEQGDGRAEDGALWKWGSDPQEPPRQQRV